MKTTQEIEDALKKTYKERLEHRKNCPHWKNREQCIECGFGLTRFLDDALGEDWEMVGIRFPKKASFPPSAKAEGIQEDGL